MGKPKKSKMLTLEKKHEIFKWRFDTIYLKRHLENTLKAKLNVTFTNSFESVINFCLKDSNGGGNTTTTDT